MMFHVSSQATITLLDKETDAPVANGSVIQVWGDVNESLLTWHNLSAVNLTGSTTKINMKRYTLSAPSTVEDYFCWYVCLGSVVSSTNPTLNHSTGACFNSNNLDTLNYFSAYYKPMGLTGSATFRYVWFNSSSPTDTAYIDITFNVTPVSVPEINLEPSVSVYPNPAKDQIAVQLENVDFNEAVTLVIYDVIGNKVIQQSIASVNTRLDISDLANGSYICTILSDKKSILTKRIIVNR